jgi:hypothetical protein
MTRLRFLEIPLILSGMTSLFAPLQMTSSGSHSGLLLYLLR